MDWKALIKSYLIDTNFLSHYLIHQEVSSKGAAVKTTPTSIHVPVIRTVASVHLKLKKKRQRGGRMFRRTEISATSFTLPFAGEQSHRRGRVPKLPRWHSAAGYQIKRHLASQRAHLGSVWGNALRCPSARYDGGPTTSRDCQPPFIPKQPHLTKPLLFVDPWAVGR